MKKFLEGVMEWKVSACMTFTGVIMLYMLITFVLGHRTIEMSMLFSLLIVSCLSSLIQFVFFTDKLFKKMRYSTRLILFVLCFGTLLTGCAVFFHWFPTNVTGAWALFILIFILVFIGLTIGFEIYFRLMGQKYDGLLGQYKKEKENNKVTK